MKTENGEISPKPIDIEENTNVKSPNLAYDFDQSLEDSKGKEDSKNSVKEDFITTFGDLLNGNEEL